jgi:hypothetical protein
VTSDRAKALAANFDHHISKRTPLVAAHNEIERLS